jgi:hypothetical protein
VAKLSQNSIQALFKFYLVVMPAHVAIMKSKAFVERLQFSLFNRIMSCLKNKGHTPYKIGQPLLSYRLDGI